MVLGCTWLYCILKIKAGSGCSLAIWWINMKCAWVIRTWETNTSFIYALIFIVALLSCWSMEQSYSLVAQRKWARLPSAGVHYYKKCTMFFSVNRCWQGNLYTWATRSQAGSLCFSEVCRSTTLVVTPSTHNILASSATAVLHL